MRDEKPLSGAPLAATGGASAAVQRRAVAAWLLVCALLVFAMVVVGGITRLTHSGLSIVEWEPIVGAIPPLDEREWQEAFARYQQTPEYRKVNRGMSLEAFKRIYWWEYAHRLLGRLIGVAFLLPLLWFALRGKIERGRIARLAGIFLLGAFQGALGWYMVQSGLVDDPRVSQYRLAAHLGVALLIYAALLWTGLDLLTGERGRGGPGAARLRPFALVVVAAVFVMALSGAFVAGTRAGFAYNTFPQMNGYWLPPGAFALEPWYRNFFDNVALVQFDHRLLAALLALLVAAFCIAARGAALSPRARLACRWVAAALLVQIALGIATLLLVVPIPLAAAHQAGALLVFTAALFAAHTLR